VTKNDDDRVAKRPEDASAPNPGSEAQDEFPEDPIIEQSIKGMPSLQVPGSFLPNVMYQVYEIHHRDRIGLGKAVLICAALLAISFGFYAWDVWDEVVRDGGGFGDVFEERTRAAIASFDTLFSAISGMLSAAWQLALGTASLLPGGAVLWIGLIAVLSLLGLIALAKSRISILSKG